MLSHGHNLNKICVEFISRNFKIHLNPAKDFKSKPKQRDRFLMFLNGMVKYFEDINSQINFYA